MSRILGSSVQFEDVSKAFEELLPEQARNLQDICKFYEHEMLLGRDSGAYFSGCLAGAAMIEAFLLLFCVLQQPAVERTESFRKFAKKKGPYLTVIAHWTLRELIPLSEELQWIGATMVEKDLVAALIDGYYEMLPAVKPGITQEEMEGVVEVFRSRPDVALLTLMQSMRNLVHAGRCIRLKRNLPSEDFADWAKLVMVLIVEVRDCMILKLNSVYQQYIVGLLGSPGGVATFSKVLNQLGGVRSPNN